MHVLVQHILHMLAADQEGLQVQGDLATMTDVITGIIINTLY